MANKTQPTDRSVEAYIDQADEKYRDDCREIAAMMEDIVGEPPKMWGASIIGFGAYHYRYESGREGDFMLAGFSPRKRNLSLYIMGGFERHEELMKQLGKYKNGKSCLYINRLDDIDRDVLRELITESVAYMRKKYPDNHASNS